ncbi:MAG: NAD-dependent epimerase/dehydratase family protein [Planctomycetes bacterium]|nr:NAD-dependent epimerase/dehydratase family protein [Planctomycetota bacterium]
MGEARKIFMTGATGIVGRALLQRLAGDKRSAGRNMPAVTVLSRSVSAFPESAIRAVHGRIAEPEAWLPELEGCTEFVHMAALTGKARARDFERVNVEGTRSVLEACKRVGVRRFLFVSSIAANYPEHDAYPYGRSKLEAEALVRASGLEWAIVRPTIVMSRRAKVWHSLESLASLPLVPLFGGGGARIQPIHADDLALGLEAWLQDPTLDRGEYDLGGPEVLTFREFLGRIQRRKRGSARFLPLPGKGAIAILERVEKVALPLLPMSAGQLYSFVYDSTAGPNALQERFASSMRNVDAILDDLLKYG